MTTSAPNATYRIQLRDGVDFAQVEGQLDYFVQLGISHLYLSPIFTAGAGSTHGYDVVTPTEIEPELGGREGFESLSRAAHEKGLGVILDIVPNHTSFTPDNPWLLDVLKHGRDSRYADAFDIDWSAGPIVLPWLPDPFAQMLDEGKLSLSDGFLKADGLQVPLAPGTEADGTGAEDLQSVHERQHWRLHHWELERDGITHRRFFNVTSLIGMRVEDADVFALTHSLLFELVRSGLVDGLRVDHVDGLADPEGYLDRLAQELPDTPVWIEKILVGEETLPETWQTKGTTGYEAARLIARVLTDEAGICALDEAWRVYSGTTESFPEALALAKSDILHNELAAEVQQLIGLANAALEPDGGVEPGYEGLREAIICLLAGMTRYRTYIGADGAGAEDRQLIDTIVEEGGAKLRSSRILEALAQHLKEPTTEADLNLAVRFQQVSGALLAKAQEDTAGFRWTRYLAANEVGAEPAEPTVTEQEANAFLAQRGPWDMTLTSSHDTKRSEDSRMRLVAISHHPDAFAALVDQADSLAPEDLPPTWRWYVAQSVLALWGEPAETLEQRLADHMVKAMREAKQESYWTKPDEALESAAGAFAAALCDLLSKGAPAELQQILDTGEALSLVQLTMKCIMPGFPDIYRGSEAPFYALTDPDNRLPVDMEALETLPQHEGFAGAKAALTRLLLHLRRDERTFFAEADAVLVRDSDNLRLTRTLGGRALVLEQGNAELPDSAQLVWQGRAANGSIKVYWSA